MTPLDDLADRAQRLGVALEDEQTARLLRYEALLMRRAVDLGLVARSDRTRIRERHLLDCLRAAPALGAARSAYDLGSGAGLPGLVVAIARPETTIGLIEGRRARAAFLELAIEELGLANATVIVSKVEDVHAAVDACLARAFAPLPRAWEAALPRLRPDGRLVYFAGREPRPSEIPAGARVEALVRASVLESSGPLVIMARQ